MCTYLPDAANVCITINLGRKALSDLFSLLNWGGAQLPELTDSQRRKTVKLVHDSDVMFQYTSKEVNPVASPSPIGPVVKEEGMVSMYPV